MKNNPLHSFRNPRGRKAAAAILAVLCPFLVVAQGTTADRTSKPGALPADAHVDQTMQLNGKALPYTVTVGTLPVENNGIKTGEVVFTAYTVKGENRPVTFALNGRTGRLVGVSELRRYRPQAH